MYVDGKLLTAGEKMRLDPGLFGVMAYKTEKCYSGYTLFSPCWDDTEYLIDMRGLIVHRWNVTHSNVAELLPNGNLFTHNCYHLFLCSNSVKIRSCLLTLSVSSCQL